MSRRYSCCDGYCGAEDCERCRPGCTFDGNDSQPYAVGDRVGRTGCTILAVEGDAVLLSDVGGDADGAQWIDGYALAVRS